MSYNTDHFPICELSEDTMIEGEFNGNFWRVNALWFASVLEKSLRLHCERRNARQD